MFAKRVVSGIGWIILFVLPIRVYAARSISIVADPLSVIGDKEITLTASVSGCTDGESLIVKGAFQREGSTNYFGYTHKDDGTWVKTGDSRDAQHQVSIGAWDGTLMVKSDMSDTGYLTFGEGEYLLKLGYYYKTSGGNWSSSVSWSNSVPITINEPDPTATPIPTPTVHVPSPTPVPTKEPTSASSPSVTPTHIPTALPTAFSSYLPEDVDMAEDETIGSALGTHSGEFLGNLAPTMGDDLIESLRATPSGRGRSRAMGIGTAIIGLGCGLMLMAATIRQHLS